MDRDFLSTELEKRRAEMAALTALTAAFDETLRAITRRLAAVEQCRAAGRVALCGTIATWDGFE